MNIFLLAGCDAGAGAWAQGGNSFGVTGVRGTNGDQAMRIKSGGELRIPFPHQQSTFELEMESDATT